MEKAMDALAPDEFDDLLLNLYEANKFIIVTQNEDVDFITEGYASKEELIDTIDSISFTLKNLDWPNDKKPPDPSPITWWQKTIRKEIWKGESHEQIS